MPTHLPDSPRASFDSLRHTDTSGAEYWLARDLAPLLEYQDWRNFLQVVEKAKTACTQSGHRGEDHFGDVTKLVDIGSGARREIPDQKRKRLREGGVGPAMRSPAGLAPELWRPPRNASSARPECEGGA